MRLHCKYKGHNNIGRSFERFPLRILNFKTSKWKKVQERYSKAFWKKKIFVNTLLIKLSYRKWDKLSNYYRDGNRLKNSIINLFDKSFSSSYFKKVLRSSSFYSKMSEMYLYFLIKPEFRIDILLWKLNFFSSSYEARQAINENKVSVNDKYIYSNYYLLKGDVISFNNKFDMKFLNIVQNRNKSLSISTVLSFVEVDYYSNTIVIVKSVKDLTADDFYLLIRSSYNLKLIKDYI